MAINVIILDPLKIKKYILDITTTILTIGGLSSLDGNCEKRQNAGNKARDFKGFKDV